MNPITFEPRLNYGGQYPTLNLRDIDDRCYFRRLKFDGKLKSEKKDEIDKKPKSLILDDNVWSPTD